MELNDNKKNFPERSSYLSFLIILFVLVIQFEI